MCCLCPTALSPGGAGRFETSVTAPAVIYSDNHLLALNKPPGLVTQPSPHHTDSLEQQAKAWVKQEFVKPGAVFLEAVHRLDRPVSGVVLFARTSKALSRLNAAMREGEISKHYLVLLEGELPSETGTLSHFLRHDNFRAVLAAEGTEGAKQAVLTYRAERRLGPFTLTAVELVTGRYHQIRAQFAAIGCPVAGDHHYGAGHSWPGAGIGLHHHSLEIEHPVRREPLILTAPVPPEWGV